MRARHGLPIVAALVTLALQAAALGCGSPKDKSAEALDSRPKCLPIQITPSKESLAITNNGAGPLTEIHLTINETYPPSGGDRAGFDGEIASIAPGTTETLSFRDVVRSDGLRFDSEKYKLLDISVRANEGTYSNLACDPNAPPGYLETFAWMKAKGGQWVDPKGTPKIITMYERAKQAMIAERQKKN
jgi:hypothetical protein